MEKHVVLEKQELKLTPEMSGVMPDLFEYFLTRLPSDLPVDVYNKGLSCRGFARLVVEDLGGPEEARAISVTEETDSGMVDADRTSHTYVVKKGSDPLSCAYNNKKGEKRTVAYVLKHGTDTTSLLFGMPWNQL